MHDRTCALGCCCAMSTVTLHVQMRDVYTGVMSTMTLCAPPWAGIPP